MPASTLGRERFAPRAAVHDAQASFPAQNYQDLRDAGLLESGDAKGGRIGKAGKVIQRGDGQHGA